MRLRFQRLWEAGASPAACQKPCPDSLAAGVYNHWSASEYNANHALYVNCNGNVNNNGKSNTYGVIPSRT